MRTDLLVDKKCIHFKLSKEVHHALRAKLFEHNISMQELFDEFAQSVVADAYKGRWFIDSIVNRKIKEALGTSKKKKKSGGMSELDSDTLYSIINQVQSKNPE
jgi:arginine deiminase